MKSVVVMPTALRPEMLALALEKLSACPDVPDVNIFVDTIGSVDDVEYVRDTYFPTALIFHARPHTLAPSGTWNILQSIKAGYDMGADLVFLIEEDVVVRPHFFDWHYQEQASGLYLATCGRVEERLRARWSKDYYTNPGACLRRDLVARLIPHMVDAYYTDLEGYLLKHFPPWKEMSILDDGLIRRVIEEMGGQVKYPEAPVCAHQGFRCYDHIDIYKNYETTIENRITRLREIISTIKPGDRYARDFESF